MKPDSPERLVYTCLLLCIILSSSPAMGQPSGGPYGPIQQVYDLPKDADKIYDIKKGRHRIPKEISGNFKIALEKTLQVAVDKRAQTAEQLKAILRGGKPTLRELKAPIRFLTIKGVEKIISGSFPVLPTERQEALMNKCLQQINFSFKVC